MAEDGPNGTKSEFAHAGLAEAIEVVRGELERAIRAGAASDVAFEAGPVELEFEVAFTRTGGGKAGLKAWVITVGGSAEVSHARTHRMKVSLSPVDRATGKRKLIGDVDRVSTSPQAHQSSKGEVDTAPSGVPQEGPGDADSG